MPTSTTAADTIKATLPYLQALTDAVVKMVSPTAGLKAQTAMAGVEDGISALAISETAIVSKPIVQRITDDAQMLLTLGASLPLPFPANIILMIASSLFPAAVNAVNLMMQHHAQVPT